MSVAAGLVAPAGSGSGRATGLGLAAVLLAGHHDEAEIPDRRAVGLCVAVDDDDAETAPGGCERMGQPDDARADNGEIVCHAGTTRAARRS